MAPLDAASRIRVLHHFQLAQNDVSSGVSAPRATSHRNLWSHWSHFCSSLAIDPLLQNVKDPVIFLQIYARLYRQGSLPHQSSPVRSRTVEDALRAIGQTLASLGSPDPRKNALGNTDFRLARQLRAYTRADPPPARVKPIPFQVVANVATVAQRSLSPGVQCTADMIILAFFFLLRPGEYTASSSSDSQPFRLSDIKLRAAGRWINILTCPTAHLTHADYVTLEFTTQKNAVKGEVIGLGRSRHPVCCPVAAAARRILHLRAHNAQPTSPLARFFDDKWFRVRPSDVTRALRAAVHFLGEPELGFTQSDIEAQSLRAGGAMALLCADVDQDKIQLLGRWRSDAMLRYLHVQAQPFLHRFAERMATHGSFVLLPNQAVPQHP